MKNNFSPRNIAKQLTLAKAIVIDLDESSFYLFNCSCFISVERSNYCSIQAHPFQSRFVISSYLKFGKQGKIEMTFREISPYEGVC